MPHHEFTMMTTDSGDSPTDETLLAKARHGEQAAFGELFDRHVKAVFWQAYGVVQDADSAQDITQEAFCTLWLKRDTVFLAKQSALPWLLVTARNLALNAARKSRRNPTLTLVEEITADTASEPESVVDTQVVANHIAHAIGGLSAIDRELFDLCVEEELSYEQAAARLGISHGAVRNRLSRLKKRLRNDLADVREES